MVIRWVSDLGARLSEEHTLVSFDRIEIPDVHQSFWSVSILQACEEFSSNIRRKAKSEEELEKSAKIEAAVHRASVELLNGAGIHQELVVAVVQKSP